MPRVPAGRHGIEGAAIARRSDSIRAALRDEGAGYFACLSSQDYPIHRTVLLHEMRHYYQNGTRHGRPSF